MIESAILIGIIIFVAILAITLLLKGLKLAFSIFSSILLILLIVSSVLLFFTYRDARDFKEKFPEAEKKFLLVDDSKILAGMIIKDFNDDIEPLDVYDTEYDKNELENILKSSWKIFIIKSKELDDSRRIDDNTQVGEVVAKLRKDELPVSESGFETEKALRAHYFAKIFKSLSDGKVGPLFVVNDIRKDKMEVYPESLMFKAIKYLPKGSIYDVQSTRWKDGVS